MGPEDRSGLVERWMRALLNVAYSPLSRPEIEATLLAMVDHLLVALWAEPFSPAAARPVGDTLVDARFSNADSLRVTIEELGPPLLAWSAERGLPKADIRVIQLLAALSAGHADAVREWLFEEQEQVKRALFVASTRAEKRFERSETRFREVFTRSAVGFAISAPGGKILMTNPALGRILGGEPDEFVGRNVEEFFHPTDAGALRTSYQEPSYPGDGQAQRARRQLMRTDQQTVWVYLAVSTLEDTDEGHGLQLTMVEDVSDLHLLQEGFSHQTLHDLLTRLPNRQYLLSRLQTVLGEQNSDRRVVLYHLDLDGFSVINDGLGPEAGDKLLMMVARRLENLFNGPDSLVVRTGGDEFAVLQWSDTGPLDVLGTINRINEHLAEPVYLDEVGVAVSASIGVSHGRAGEIDPHELLRAADITLRRMLAAGHRQWAEFDPIRDQEERRRLRLAAALPGALEFGELHLAWLPWISLSTGELMGVSARLSWDHPTQGTIDHDTCLELAAETGAILPIGSWLLRAACEQSAAWRQELGEHVPAIGIGLTGTQARDPDLVGGVAAALRTSGLPHEKLTLGMPAAAFNPLDGEARENAGVLDEMGVRLVLGEVGASPTDVGILDEFPAIAIEVSTRLVSRLQATSAESVLNRTAAAGLAAVRDRQLPVLVRGVDTADQLAWWRAVGAVAGSGDELSPPLSAEEFAARFLRQRS
jgi:diguanylate cyclase (GGDEF)-like protein/PAS domain S-box-containing protein